MKQENNHLLTVILGLAIAFLVGALILWSISREGTVIPTEDRDIYIIMRDSTSKAHFEELEIKDSIISRSHKRTLELEQENAKKIKNKYVTIRDSIMVLPSNSKTEFIREFYSIR